MSVTPEDRAAIIRVSASLVESERAYAVHLDTLLQTFWIPLVTNGIVDAQVGRSSHVRAAAPPRARAQRSAMRPVAPASARARGGAAARTCDERQRLNDYYSMRRELRRLRASARRASVDC